MFDWNDEELANIIWGEAKEGDDHIVPYPDDNKDYSNKKEQNQDASASKPAGQKKRGEKHDFPDLRLGNTSRFDKHGSIASSRLSMDSWPHLPLSNFIINDQESINSEVSNDVMETDDSAKGETTQHDRDHPMFENARDEEDTDFVGYGWENIGSFDDLDRIFSNDEPLFGNALGNTNYLWPSKDVTNRSIKSFSISGNSPNLGSEALTDTSEILQVKSENVAQDGLSPNFAFGKVNDPASSLSFSRPNALLEHTAYGDRSKTAVKGQSNCPSAGYNIASPHCVADNSVTALSEKGFRPKKHQKGQRRTEGKAEGKSMRDMHGAWPSPANSSEQYEQLQLSAPSISQLRQMRVPQSLHYQHLSNPYLYVPAFGNVATPYPGMPSVSHSHSGVYKSQAVLSGYKVSSYEVTPTKKQLDSLDKPANMTPQEKIEKLRRRQQMQAMLAIQKQQEQFGHHVCSSVPQKCPSQSQARYVEGSELDLDDTSAPLPSVDLSSAIKQSTISAEVVDYAAEEIVLYRLQDAIAKLDSRKRLCIRDSLFRLVKSAVRRHYTSDTSSTNTQTKRYVSKEEINTENKVVKMPDVETDTNPIDRAVAQLLFHRPMEPTVKHLGTPKSPLSAELPTPENKTSNAANLRSGASPNGSKTEPTMSHQSPTCSGKDDLLRTSPSEDPAHDGTMDLEASQGGNQDTFQ